MSNQNIQIGIDLGTTNSEIAINNKDNVEIVKNMFGDEYTPSVFGIDISGNMVVGKKSYERLYKDASKEEFVNNKAEVKRLMGTEETVCFERTNQKMTPEEISAEILKSLKGDLLRKHPDFNTQAAVISIPAYFSTLQAESTKRAGNIAGFDHVVLLQEPIAAAISYGFMSSKNENWIIYDLGGGTFDVALISSKEGSLLVLGHNGDNFLGGKDFDSSIVDKIIVPKIIEKYALEDFNRSNPKYGYVFARLKYIAETVKIDLSQYGKTTIEIKGIGDDQEGNEIYLPIDLSRKDYEKLVEPFVSKTIELTQKTIKESGINQSSISKIILVGGATQMPYIKYRLESELKIVADSSIDPFTVVARGACVYAISQKIPKSLIGNIKTGDTSTKSVSIEYESLVAETEEMVAGVIKELEDSKGEYFIQIQSDSGHYSGSKVKLKNGKFFQEVILETHKTNLFWIYLFDKQGNAIPVEPDSFSITHGLSISGAPIPHTIGVAIAKRDAKSGFALTEIYEHYFEKGSILPLRESRTYHTVKKLKKGDNQDILPIKVYEGESEIPDRNHLLFTIKITGKEIPYDLPENTDVELTIEQDESRDLKAELFIPTIDLYLNARSEVYAEKLDVKELEAELNKQKKRSEAVEANCSASEKARLHNIIQSINTSLKGAYIDQDEKRKAHKQIKDLKVQLDKIEKEKEMPQITIDFNSKISGSQELISKLENKQGKNKNKAQLKILEEEGKKAIANNDVYLLTRINEQIKELEFKLLWQDPDFVTYQFQRLSQENTFTNEKEASNHINKGRKAIERGDIEELKECIGNLVRLLPPEEQEVAKQILSGIKH